MYGMNFEALAAVGQKNNKTAAAETGYKVKKGDTLYSLAKKFNMSVEEFKKYTGLSGGPKAGEILKVPQYKISASFSSVAKKYNITSAELLELNPQLKNNPANAKKNSFINVPKAPFEKAKAEKAAQAAPAPADGVKSEPVSSNPDDRTVVLKNGKKTTVGALHKEMLAKAPDGASRPKPVINEKGEIAAEVKVIEPHSKGYLSGKTIIVNAGHGGYNPKNGAFDAGTSAENTSGNTVEEWAQNREFALELIPKLTLKGARVIFISGSAATVADAKKKYKSADMFISLHCDSSPKTEIRGQTVLYTPGDGNNKQLADSMQENIAKHPETEPDSCRVRPDKRGLAVLKASPLMPSVLLETGFQSNPEDLKNIESREYRNKFAELVSKSVVDYFAQKDIKKYKLLTHADVFKFSSQKSKAGSTSKADKAEKTQKSATIREELNKFYSKFKPAPKPKAEFGKRTVHEVESGETLSRIEEDYGLLPGELADYNKLSSANLAIGQKLKIPEHVRVENIKTKQDAARATGLSAEFLSELERVESKNYSMENGKPTIGVGHYPFTDFEKKYYRNKNLSESQVYMLLTKDITKAQAKIKAEIGEEAYENLTQKQKEALVDFVFNRGETVFRSKYCAPLREALVKGDYDTAAINLKHNLDYKTKQVKCGLCRRRLQEMARFCDGDFSPKVIKGAQKLYEEGLKAARQEGLPKHVIDDYTREVRGLFDNRVGG